jgi:hypothetical protein
MVEDELEEALFHRAGSRVELRPAVPLDPIGDVEAHIAAAVEGRGNLELSEQQHQAAHREAPVIIGRGLEGLRPGRRHEGEAARPQRLLDVSGRARRMARMLENVAADREVERLLAQFPLQGPPIAADVGDAVDVGALDQIEADEPRLGAEARSHELAPVAHIAVGNERARPDLQDPGRPLADRLGHPVQHQVDLARDAGADDA